MTFGSPPIPYQLYTGNSFWYNTGYRLRNLSAIEKLYRLFDDGYHLFLIFTRSNSYTYSSGVRLCKYFTIKLQTATGILFFVEQLERFHQHLLEDLGIEYGASWSKRNRVIEIYCYTTIIIESVRRNETKNLLQNCCLSYNIYNEIVLFIDLQKSHRGHRFIS